MLLLGDLEGMFGIGEEEKGESVEPIGLGEGTMGDRDDLRRGLEVVVGIGVLDDMLREVC